VSLRSQAGFGLVEVLVSAMLVVVAALAVFGSLDSASRASGDSKAKAVAANLAQQDQERLRSITPSDLPALDAERVEDVDGVPFSVRSQGEYNVAPTSTAGCTGGRKDEYLKITSTVSWPGRGDRKPVQIESLVAPPLAAIAPGRGSALVRVTRNDGVTPVPDLPIAISGPDGFSQQTGPEGCAFFAHVPVGTYTGTFSRSGWRDPGGNEVVTFSLTVTSDQTASIALLYDESGGSVTVETWTHLSTATPAWTQDRSDVVTLHHSSLQTNGGRVLASPADENALTVTATGLQPFTSPYSVYSGSCEANRLTGMSSSELALIPPEYVREFTVDQSAMQTIKIFEPAFDVRIRVNGAPFEGATVIFKSTTSGCEQTFTQVTNAEGRLPLRGLPFGSYTICAEHASYPNYRYRVTDQRNDQFEGKRIDLDENQVETGTCATV